MKKMKKMMESWNRNGVTAMLLLLVFTVAVLISASDCTAKESDEVYYMDLYYGNVEDDEMRKLCVELDAEGECPFEADTNYLMRFDFPDKMREEIAAGQGTYEISIGYDFQVAAGEHGCIIVEARNPETHRVYASSHSAFEAMDDLCLKHRVFMYPDGTLTMSEFTVDMDNLDVTDCLMFVLYTSASPEDGPKSTIIKEDRINCTISAISD